ncbi:hypothetical protein CPLU01_02626 [Colletotrichum plurivorum]|uniref:Uncharacterized protein n=1 Tax=Colletotrichum plurivorum TaxID=2175906 RepID=A0A8H6NMP3_9PEZI|nr:hypothetical protein CPLU01_02626 [Colletotrichum plurivorum]
MLASGGPVAGGSVLYPGDEGFVVGCDQAVVGVEEFRWAGEGPTQGTTRRDKDACSSARRLSRYATMEGLRAAAVKGLFLTLGLWLFLNSVGTQPTRQDVKQGLSLNLAGEGVIQHPSRSTEA